MHVCASGRPVHALLCLEQSRVDEGMQAIGQAYKLELGSPQLLCALGGALLGVGKWADAEGALRRGLGAAPESAAAHTMLGHALIEQVTWMACSNMHPTHVYTCASG